MKVRVFAFLAVGIVMLAQQALACGEKFLIVGRGSKFQRSYVALHPASAVVLNSGLTARREFQSRLKLAGHRIRLVSNTGLLRQALEDERFDLVLADITDATAVEAAMLSTGSDAVFLPVVDAASPTPQGQYRCPLKQEGGAKSRNFLTALDAVMDSKRKAKPIACTMK